MSGTLTCVGRRARSLKSAAGSGGYGKEQKRFGPRFSLLAHLGVSRGGPRGPASRGARGRRSELRRRGGTVTRGHEPQERPDKAAEFPGERDGHLGLHDAAAEQVTTALIQSGLHLPTQFAIREGLALLAQGERPAQFAGFSIR